MHKRACNSNHGAGPSTSLFEDDNERIQAAGFLGRPADRQSASRQLSRRDPQIRGAAGR
ncbi:hypothetical protein AGR2A_Cc30152 [Agrobacterium genomosp. 2 str. CFBP 5494]|uniref:Uncharacterized protein n=2 Tax=Agrobacterium TaxID=357 RepID=U4Q0K0_9HYPH|nr:protein of unknown function [Agrobacterium pusense]CUW91990.1 hypothetical protein AGR2A_Cc30152 [Agrobacterium genomosp. 2 str. CFBP 5494]